MSDELHRKKKAPWLALSLQIILYDIKSMKHADVEGKDIVNFDFGTKDFNLYDPHKFFKDHCTRAYFPWIDRIFNWSEENPWMYCYNASRIKESINMGRTRKVALKIATILEATTTTAEGINLVRDKRKRKH